MQTTTENYRKTLRDIMSYAALQTVTNALTRIPSKEVEEL